MIEDWYVADLSVDGARERHESVYSERLSRTGDNLADVTKFIYDNYPEVFKGITEKMSQRVPGVSDVEATVTADGYVVLRFQNGVFKNPFASKFVSDGTIKMFTYLILLNDPYKHALLCVEEPENQLYPELLEVLAEEFQMYSAKEGQVFVSTHSPDFLNAADLESVFVLVKQDGFTRIMRATDNELAYSLYKAGDRPGFLWKQKILTEMDV